MALPAFIVKRDRNAVVYRVALTLVQDGKAASSTDFSVSAAIHEGTAIDVWDSEERKVVVGASNICNKKDGLAFYDESV